MRQITVYALINDSNGKIYVGMTTRPIKYRLHEHLKLLQKGEHTAFGLQEDYDAGHTFHVEKLEEVENPHRNLEERIWMLRLKTYDERYGYNSRDTAMKGVRRRAGFRVEPSPLKGRKSPLAGIKGRKNCKGKKTVFDVPVETFLTHTVEEVEARLMEGTA